MFDKFDLIVTTLEAAGLTAYKSDMFFANAAGSLSIPDDADQVITVQPLTQAHVTQSGKEKISNATYQLLAMSKDESAARTLLDQAINAENNSSLPTPALPLPHYKQVSSNYVGRIRQFFVYEKVISVSPRAS